MLNDILEGVTIGCREDSQECWPCRQEFEDEGSVHDLACTGGTAPMALLPVLLLTSVQMHQENGMPFKSFVSTLMELLEDADGMVRDTARNSVIALFQYVCCEGTC